MSFLPQGYQKPDTKVEDRFSFLITQAGRGKSWAGLLLRSEYGEGDHINGLDDGEPPSNK